MMIVGFFLFSKQECCDPSKLVFSTTLLHMVKSLPPKQNVTVSVPSKPSQERKPAVPLAPRNNPAKMVLQPKIPRIFGTSPHCPMTV